MALVRVYCGLAASQPRQEPGAESGSLTVVLVDDAGRLLDIRDLDDHPKGYASLSSLLAERASGPYSVAIAADSDQHLVSRLLAAAGWALATVDHRTTEDYCDRFADDLTDDTGPVSPQRRALGLARALHAGVLTATTMPPPSELADLKPVLAADSALATGRYGAAVALREVLRELYPAALRAYPDPANPVALAVMDALPEPGALATSSTGRGRDAAAAALDEVTARLAADGVADPAAINEAITALRVAVAETPRRSVNRELAATVAQTVRRTVAAVRACDESRDVLISALAERVWSPPRAREGTAAVPAPRAAESHPPPPAATGRAARAFAAPAPAHAQAGSWAPATAQPASAAYDDGGRIHGASAPHREFKFTSNQPDPTYPDPTRPAAAPASGQPTGRPISGQPRGRPASGPPAEAPASGHPVAPVSGRPMSGPAGSRPVSAPPPPPPGITPIADVRSANRRPHPRADRWERPGQGHYASAPHSATASAPQNGEMESRVPTPRPSPEGPPPGSRTGWPTSPPDDEWAALPPDTGPTAAPAQATGPAEPTPPPVTPPWLADDLRAPEPPSLRLVEPTLPEELRGDLGFGGRPEPPPLRLVETDESIPRSIPPVDASEGDGDLLIFAQARSAWFSDQIDTAWSSPLDAGWQVAEVAARPSVSGNTDAGLPRRVPRANLVPGSPPTDDERPLRVVRDPASIAAHTSGYFNGWRRGQEVGGYALGSRSGPGAGAWDFARDDRLSG